MQIKFPVQEKGELFSLVAALWGQKEKVLMGLVVVVMGSVFLARGALGKDRLIKDYMQAALYQTKLEGRGEFDQGGLLQLLKKHPELKPVFSHYLEEQFALSGDFMKAKGISEESFKRLSFIDPAYQEFAKTSLLIEEGKYEEALARALQIKGEMKQETAPNLYGLNLIRISFLESLLGKKKTQIEEALSQELTAHLKDGRLSLSDFVR